MNNPVEMSETIENDRKFQEELDLAVALSLSEANSIPSPTVTAASITTTHAAVSTNQTPPSDTRPAAGVTAPSSSTASWSNRFGSMLLGLIPTTTAPRSASVVRTCSGCQKPITFGRYLVIKDQFYHSDCFRCAGCNECLTQRVSYYGYPPLPYHPACAQALLIGGGGGTLIPNDELGVLLNGLSQGDKPPNATVMARKEVSSRCHSCNQLITYGEYVTSQDRLYHKDCFRCAACHQCINGQVRYEEDLPYHPSCANELFNPHCCLCGGVIEGTYAKHPYFSNELYCFEHTRADKPLKSCFACGRKEPFPISHKEGFTDLPDGRSLCPLCSSSVIMDSEEANQIYRKICDFFEQELHLIIPPEMRGVPILAVDTQAINENRANATVGNHKTGSLSNTPTTRGLTLSSVGTIRHFNHNFLTPVAGSTNTFFVKAPRKFLQQQELFRIEHVRDVTAVLVLYGLPHDLFASILAHEATHVWLKLTKTIPYDLPPEVEEGICQLIAYKYLEHLDRQKDSKTAQKIEQSQETELHFFQYQIENDTSLVYGDGFRAAKKVDASLGLDVLLEYIAQNKSFPSI